MNRWLGFALSLFVLTSAFADTPSNRSGVVTFIDGDVKALAGTEWVDLAEGAAVAEATHIRTGKASGAEIRFAQFGVVRIAASTEVALKTVGLGQKKRSVDLELLSGAVTAKVSKLLGDDRFQVQTRNVVCGVRGTKFAVSADGEQPSTIEVEEGQVALLPPNFDPKLYDSSDPDAPTPEIVRQVLKQIVDAATKVSVGHQALVTKEALQPLARALDQVGRFLAEAVQQGPGLPPPEGLRQALEGLLKTPPPPPGSLPVAPLGDAVRGLLQGQDSPPPPATGPTQPPKPAPAPAPKPAPPPPKH